jgi:dCTP deaminase
VILSDRDLALMYAESNPEPASIDLHVGDTLLVWPDYVRRDPRYDQSRLWRPVELEDINGPVWILKPGLRYLAATEERIKILPDCAGELTGRSSWGRDGMEIHRTAGWLDPGYVGSPTLELSVVGSEITLWPGARVCQLIIHQLTTPAARPYSGKYQGDKTPTPSRSFREARP